MRSSGLPPMWLDATRVLLVSKPWEETRGEIIQSAATAARRMVKTGVGIGGKIDQGRLRWRVDLWLRAEAVLIARLSANDSPILGLDWHRNSSDDGDGGIIGPGYHWDFYPPVAPSKRKEPLDIQPRDAYDALELLISKWFLEVTPDDTRNKARRLRVRG